MGNIPFLFVPFVLAASKKAAIPKKILPAWHEGTRVPFGALRQVSGSLSNPIYATFRRNTVLASLPLVSTLTSGVTYTSFCYFFLLRSTKS